jgi:hypothetical protein
MIMHQRFKHSTIALLLGSYLFVGSVAQFEAFGHIFGIKHGPYSYTQSKPVNSSSSKVYWTQHKHIPSFVKIVVPSPEAVAFDDYSGDLRYFFVPFDFSPIAHSAPSLSLHSTRAPPIIS